MKLYPKLFLVISVLTLNLLTHPTAHVMYPIQLTFRMDASSILAQFLTSAPLF